MLSVMMANHVLIRMLHPETVRDSFYSLVAYPNQKITKIRTPFGLALLGSAGFKLKMACKILISR